MSRVAEILLAQGRTQAERSRDQAAVWGQALANIGNIPAQINQQRHQHALVELEQAKAKREGALTDIQLAQLQRQQQEQTALDNLYQSADVWDDQGRFDTQKATDVARANGAGHLVPKIVDLGAKWNEQAEKTNLIRQQALEAQAKVADANREALGIAALGLDPQDEGSYHAYIGTAAKAGWLSADDANRYLTAPPEARSSILNQFIQQSKVASERIKPREVPAGATLVDRRTNQPVYTAPKTNIPLEEQLLDAVAKGDTARANQIKNTMREAAEAKRDPNKPEPDPGWSTVTMHDDQTGKDTLVRVNSRTGQVQPVTMPTGLTAGKGAKLNAQQQDQIAAFETLKQEGNKVLQLLKDTGLDQSNDPVGPRWNTIIATKFKMAPTDPRIGQIIQRIQFVKANAMRALTGSRMSQYVAQQMEPHLPDSIQSGKQAAVVLQNVLEQSDERERNLYQAAGVPAPDWLRPAGAPTPKNPFR